MKPDKYGPEIPHDGGPCPCPDAKDVLVKFRDGHISCAIGANAWLGPTDWWEWQGAPETNIIAYALPKDDAS